MRIILPSQLIQNSDTIERIREQVIKKFMDKASIIYKEDSSEDYFIVCKKQRVHLN